MAKIGALKMLMLNMEQNSVEGARPPSACDHELVGSTDRQLEPSNTVCSNSNAVHDSGLIGFRDSKGSSASARHKPEEQTTATGSGFPGIRGLEASSASAGADLDAIACVVRQVLSQQLATQAAIEEIRAALVDSGALYDGSVTTRAPRYASVSRTKLKSRAADCDPDILCRSRLTSAAHCRRLQLRWSRERWTGKSQKNPLPAETQDACNDSAESATIHLQSFQMVPSQDMKGASCKNTSYESTSDTNFNLTGGKVPF